jgi:hypothetical protein
MKTLTITIALGNDAFTDNEVDEVNRILRRYTAFNDLAGEVTERALLDSNGNKVGCVEIAHFIGVPVNCT